MPSFDANGTLACARCVPWLQKLGITFLWQSTLSSAILVVTAAYDKEVGAMDGSYWDAAELVMSSLEEDGRKERTLACYKRGIIRLAGHLDAKGLECTTESVEAWLGAGREAWSDGVYRENSAAAHRMAEALEDGTVGVRPHLPEGPRGYGKLSGWSLEAVEGFVEHFRAERGDAKAKLCERYATQFMLRAGLSDAQPADLTADVIVGYVRSCGGTKGTRRLKLTHLRQLLAYLHGVGNLPAWAPMLASDRFADHAECYGAVCDWGPGDADPESFLVASGKFVEALRGAGYSVTAVCAAAKILQMLYIALALNGACYSPGNADAWFGEVAGAIGGQPERYGRMLVMFSRFAASGRIDAAFEARTPDPMAAFPPWAGPAFAAYAAIRGREGVSGKTIAGNRQAALRLATFADARGAGSWMELNAETVAAWCAEDPHSTAGGRANYVHSARGFLEFLEEEGLAAPGISIAAHVECAQARRVVEVLDEGQVELAGRARLSASTPMELRDAAMVALGLTMGMRACDVAGLRMSDISWRDSSVTFVQRKTCTRVTLPLTVAAGNAVVAYLREGRPPSASPMLFVSHVAPFGGVTKYVCSRAMERTFGPGLTRFHTLRRTFATRMLEAGAGRGDVAEALGHSGGRSVAPYLSLDAERMRMCALSPAECGIGDPE